MEIVTLFCDIDDFCLQFEPLWQQHLISEGSRQRWPETRTWLSEVRSGSRHGDCVAIVWLNLSST